MDRLSIILTLVTGAKITGGLVILSSALSFTAGARASRHWSSGWSWHGPRPGSSRAGSNGRIRLGSRPVWSKCPRLFRSLVLPKSDGLYLLGSRLR